MGFLYSERANWAKIFIVTVCATFVFTSVAQLLPEDEVQVLRRISSGLQYNYLNISQSSCIDATPFNNTFVSSDIGSNVTCDCSFNNNTLCHVTHMRLRGLNMTGSLPVEFADLTYLLELDVGRNYLSGSIPTAFGQLRVVVLSLIGNRLTGTIPEEIADITTLEEFVADNNLLEGNLPANLGNLRNLRRLLLSANNFNGTIPVTYANLRNLTDFRIDGSRISGRIPDFIGNWTGLERLDMQGTSLEGPIPETISQLRNLTFLRISDLNVSTMNFPNLEGMSDMTQLILRNCSIIGPIPVYLGDLNELRTLDLSFNMLNGQIPSSLQRLTSINRMFLSHNSLTGEIPGWILGSRDYIDLSYNNFTQSGAQGCQFPNVNLVASQSSSTSNSVPWCVQPDLPCPRNNNRHTLYINCGGASVNFDGNEYDENASDQGPAHFESNDRWAYSSTGIFMGDDGRRFVARNDSPMVSTGGDEIYQTARLSASSLKFYGLCLRRGSYRVRLHFAEIMFSNDTTFRSVGRRMFDVAIQGEVVLTDFNIANEANGTGIGIFRDFNVLVNGSTLEIHLYWTGKGTTAIPQRGIYGPLISAIAVTPNFDVSTGLSVGAIIGIVISSFVVVLLILLLLWWKGCFGGRDLEDKELRALELQTGYYSLRQIKAATNNFDNSNKIGEGGFGSVYKGVLSDGTVIAVKQLSAKSKQGNREFVNEIGMISALQHPNLVKLFGCCIEGNQLLLIYEYLENNCLARALFGRPEQRLNLDWPTRNKICIGIAKGLAYLHEESRLKIVHRDIKATNVLLDKDLNAKISDFGLAKLDEEENTHISTRIAGTIGYMAPEYAMRGYLTDKADVYSFGIVALEIVSGKSNTNYRPKEEFVYLLDWAYVLAEQGNLLELVDPILGSNYSKKEAMRMLNLSLLCANPSPTLRPSMSSVVSMLEGKIPVQAPVVKRDGAMNVEDMRFRAIEVLSQDSQTRVSNISKDSREQVSMDGPWIDSSVSLSSTRDETKDHSSSSRLLPDLYNVNLD
ncbi:hypothetical protein ACJIZ3_011198 [Penstemon smallii]|uniref:non-specific serine/threonine protein kinase n=1 Tax=Penstemon smallii TaxID=265156 RepID=A0ABD3UKN3_9LAMI